MTNKTKTSPEKKHRKIKINTISRLFLLQTEFREYDKSIKKLQNQPLAQEKDPSQVEWHQPPMQVQGSLSFGYDLTQQKYL